MTTRGTQGFYVSSLHKFPKSRFSPCVILRVRGLNERVSEMGLKIYVTEDTSAVLRSLSWPHLDIARFSWRLMGARQAIVSAPGTTY